MKKKFWPHKIAQICGNKKNIIFEYKKLVLSIHVIVCGSLRAASAISLYVFFLGSCLFLEWVLVAQRKFLSIHSADWNEMEMIRAIIGINRNRGSKISQWFTCDSFKHKFPKSWTLVSNKHTTYFLSK